MSGCRYNHPARQLAQLQIPAADGACVAADLLLILFSFR